MNEHAQAMLEIMWPASQSVPTDLIHELDTIDKLCKQTSCMLESRQVIASVIARYIPRK